MITRTRIRLATALTVLALGGIAACGHAGASAEVAAAVPSPASTSSSPTTTRATPPPSAKPADPGVTTQQLLTGDDFTDHGWGKADVYRGFEGDAGLNLSQCSGEDAPDADGYVGLVAWLYEGSQTHGVEMAVGFEDSASASSYAASYASVVTNHCRTVIGDGWEVLKIVPSAPDGATRARTWVIREDTDDGPVLRVISVITADRRVAVLHLSSTTADPSTTVDLQALLQTATDRLTSR